MESRKSEKKNTFFQRKWRRHTSHAELNDSSRLQLKELKRAFVQYNFFFMKKVTYLGLTQFFFLLDLCMWSPALPPPPLLPLPPPLPLLRLSPPPPASPPPSAPSPPPPSAPSPPPPPSFRQWALSLLSNDEAQPWGGTHADAATRRKSRAGPLLNPFRVKEERGRRGGEVPFLCGLPAAILGCKNTVTVLA